MAERMTKVEQLTLPGFKLVILNYRHFYFYIHGDQPRQQAAIGNDIIGIVLKKRFKHISSRDAGMFYHFSHTIGPFIFWKRGKKFMIMQNEGRLIDRT